MIVPVTCATKNTQFGNVMYSRECNIKRSGRRRNLDCATAARGKGTLVSHLLGAESVELHRRKDRPRWLLHEEKVAPGSMEVKADTSVTKENKSSTYERVQEDEQGSIALRTVLVILKHEDRRLQINCLLDEGSDTLYVNENVIQKLGLDGRKEKVIINVANGQKVSQVSATLDIGLESLDSRMNTNIVAKT